MFSIKVAYKGKNIALPKGINSLLKIQDQIKNRYPGQFLNGVTFKFQDIEIESFEQLHTYVPSNGGKSLKIHAQPTNLAKSSQIKPESSKMKTDLELPNCEQQNNLIPKGEESTLKLEKACQAIEQGIKTQINETDQNQLKIVENTESVDEKKNNFYNNEFDVDCVETICIKLDEPQISQTQIQKVQIPQITDQVETVQKQPFQITTFEQGEGLKQQDQNVQNYPSYISNEGLREDDVEQLREVEPGVYQCVFCKELQLCNVCDTKRKIGENSKLIKMINKIVERKMDEKVEERLQKIQKQMAELNKKRNDERSQLKKQIPNVFKKEEIQIFSSSILREEKKKLIESIEEIHGDYETNKKHVEIGQQFSWMFNIQFKHSVHFPQQIQIMDNKNLKVIKSFQVNNRETIVEVGPYLAEKEGQMERTFRLSYNDGDEITLFGPKFGFNVEVMKRKIHKALSTRFRMEVERIKKAYRIEKSTEYLIQKLKQMGINEENGEVNQELLTDILQTV